MPARGPAGPPATAPVYLPPPGRSKGRGDVDTAVRVREWEETHADLTANTDEAFFHLRLFTDRLDAETAACEIAAAFDALATAAAPHAVAGCRDGVAVRPPG